MISIPIRIVHLLLSFPFFYFFIYIYIKKNYLQALCFCFWGVGGLEERGQGVGKGDGWKGNQKTREIFYM